MNRLALALNPLQDTAPVAHAPARPGVTGNTDPVLVSLRDVHLSYGVVPVLKGIDLCVRCGEAVQLGDHVQGVRVQDRHGSGGRADDHGNSADDDVLRIEPPREQSRKPRSLQQAIQDSLLIELVHAHVVRDPAFPSNGTIRVWLKFRKCRIDPGFRFSDCRNILFGDGAMQPLGERARRRECRREENPAAHVMQ